MTKLPIGLKSNDNQAIAITAQLTLAEKASLLSGRNFWYLEGIDRFDIPSVMVTDGPHGLRKQNRQADHVGLNKSVPATCFPTASALASSWDTQLIEAVGVALGEQSAAEDVAVLLGPGMNIKRHPLCGRNFEYFSEDPLLTGKMAAAMIRGVQSQGVGTSAKHFAVNNQEHGRMYIDAIVDERSLREIYLRGFEIAITEAQPWTVMSAYNRVNGTFCSEHDWLLNQVLRQEWGFAGLVVTDWGATNDRVKGVAAGLDLEMPGNHGVNDALVEQAVLRGELNEEALDRAVARNVALSLAGAKLLRDTTSANQSSHHELAKQAVIQSAVLLKNEDNLLPLAKDLQIGVIGAFAKKPRFQGTGSSQVNPTQIDNAWDALCKLTDPTKLEYACGYDPKHSLLDHDLIAQAVGVATRMDTVILFVGLPSIYESEGFDRDHMDLPEQHNRLVEAVCSVNSRVVVVLSNGAPVAMPWANQTKAILEGYLAGQAGGGAIVDLLTGIANPSGKLAETFQFAHTDAPADLNFPGANRQVQYREGLYVGYRYFDSAKVDVAFPFGHGLSYTEFRYSKPTILNGTLSLTEPVKVCIDITNTGQMPGAEAVQLYQHALNSKIYRAEQSLVGFAKLMLAPGETKTATFNLDERSFAYFDQGHEAWTIESGEYEIRFAASSRDIRHTLQLTIAGTQSNANPSSIAIGASGPDLTHHHAIDDETFAAMLDKPVPAAEPIRPFHENSSVAEVAQTWLGAKIKARVVTEFKASMGGNAADETLNKMFDEMANNMPMRGLALFSGGKTNMSQIRLMLALLNHQYIHAGKLWWQSRRKS